MQRLRLMPGSYRTVLGGKMALYSFVCFLQLAIMLLAGLYLMPLAGLPKLVMGTNPAAIVTIALSTALAANAYGVLIGTVFKTHHQASTFGAVSIVLLAAMGGIWVPVIAMPAVMAKISLFSPLAWGLNACNEGFLKDGHTQAILPEDAELLACAGDGV